MKSPPQEQPLTKIVCTVGRQHGASYKETLHRFHDAGMSVARLNMSHCSADYSKEETVLKYIQETEMPDEGLRLASLGDLQGPKMRLGYVAEENGELPTDEEILLRNAEESDDPAILPIPAPLGETIFQAFDTTIQQQGQPIPLILGDGDAVLEITRSGKNEASARVVVGGRVRSRMGFTPRGVDLELQSFTEKDQQDLAFLLQHGVTYVGVSFVRSSEDLKRLRCHIRDHLKIDRHIPLIAKIETAPAVQNIRSIIAEADGIMVARGDLGIHINIEEIPQVQKQIVQLCRIAAKPVIIATQMLESMTGASEPTRAEVTDVFNAITDGCDAVMLSGETSYGDHPIQAIEVMGRIARRAEMWREENSSRTDSAEILLNIYEDYNDESQQQMTKIDDELSHAAHLLADGIGCKLIACLTTTGATPRRVGRFRSRRPIIAGAANVEVMREMMLSYGVHPTLLQTTDEDKFELRMDQFTKHLSELGWVQSGDALVLTGRQLPWPKGGTNLLKVYIVP